MSFETTEELLKLNYTFVKGKEKDYYCDANNKIVATINQQIITLYIADPLDELETQYQVVALPIINPTVSNTKQQIIKLIGAYNDVEILDGKPIMSYNDELDRISGRLDVNKNSQRNLGKIGIISNGTAVITLTNNPIIFSLKEKPNKPIQITRKNPVMIKMPKGSKRKYC